MQLSLTHCLAQSLDSQDTWPRYLGISLAAHPVSLRLCSGCIAHTWTSCYTVHAIQDVSSASILNAVRRCVVNHSSTAHASAALLAKCVVLVLQVQRLARRLRLPVQEQAWAVIGFEEGALPALPLPSPAKSSPTKFCNPPASPSIALPSPALEILSAPRANLVGGAAGSHWSLCV